MYINAINVPMAPLEETVRVTVPKSVVTKTAGLLMAIVTTCVKKVTRAPVVTGALSVNTAKVAI